MAMTGTGGAGPTVLFFRLPVSLKFCPLRIVGVEATPGTWPFGSPASSFGCVPEVSAGGAATVDEAPQPIFASDSTSHSHNHRLRSLIEYRM